MNSKSLCKNCGHNEIMHDGSGCRDMKRTMFFPRGCRCTGFDAYDAPETLQEAMDRMTPNYKVCEDPKCIFGWHKHIPGEVDAITKIVEEFDNWKVSDLKMARQEIRDFLRTALISHGKTEREKGYKEAFERGEIAGKEIEPYAFHGGFTKGIEAAKEVVKNIRRFEGKEGFDMWQAAIDTIETDLNSLKETNTK